MRFYDFRVEYWKKIYDVRVEYWKNIESAIIFLTF